MKSSHLSLEGATKILHKSEYHKSFYKLRNVGGSLEFRINSHRVTN